VPPAQFFSHVGASITCRLWPEVAVTVTHIADTFAADNQMIEHMDSKKLACLDERPCGLDVLRAGGNLAAWVIMRADNGGGI